MRKLLAVLSAAMMILSLGAVLTIMPVAAASGAVIYDSTVSPLPANLPSEGPEAYAFRELGDEVTFDGTLRTLNQVTVTLTSWACENGNWYTPVGSTDGTPCTTTPGATFQVPITFNIYNVGTGYTAGSLIATDTETFTVPYRPSSDANCPDGEAWYDTATQTCNHGIAKNITFDFSTQGITLPNTVIYGISYNTTHYGPNPIGESASCFSSSAGCAYDSLNIALSPQVVVGSKPYPDTVFQNSPYGSEYCDHGAAGTGSFRLDSPSAACWSGYIPAVQFVANTLPPTEKDQCKNGGWQQFNAPAFTNQGQCVSFVQANEHAKKH